MELCRNKSNQISNDNEASLEREGEGADFFDPPSMELIPVVELVYGNKRSLPSIEVKLFALDFK